MNKLFWRSAHFRATLSLAALALSACSGQQSVFLQGLTRPPTVVNFAVSSASLPVASVGSKSTLMLTLRVSGGYRPTLESETLPVPFAWIGGAFPGTGGTCAADRIFDGCRLAVEFEPPARGVFSKTLSLSYAGGEESVEALALPISGATPAEVILRSPTSVLLGDAVVGAPTSVVHLEIEHVSGAPAAGLSVISATPGLGYEGGSFPGTTGNCPASLSSGSCRVAVVVTPTSSGALNAAASLRFSDGAEQQEFVTTLTATVRHPARLRATPTTVSLGRIYLGGHVDFPITLTYLEGDHHANGIALLGLAGEVSFAGGSYPGTGGDCPNAISSGSCTIMLRAEPAALGTAFQELRIAYRSGSLWAYSNVQLSWDAATPALLEWDDPSALDFGAVAVGATASREILVRHTEGDPSATSLSVSLPANFARSGGTCGTSLAAAQACTLQIVYSPTAAGPHSGNLGLSYHNGGRVVSVTRAVSGTTQAQLAISPAAGHDFGTRAVGALVSQAFTVTHVGGSPATGLTPSTPGSTAFSVASTTCGSILAAGSCTVTVRLQAAATGSLAGALSLAFANGIGSDQLSVPLSVNAVPPAVLSPSSATLSFGQTVTGGTFSQTLTLTHASGGVGASAISILNLAAPYSLTSSGCTAGLATSGNACDLVIAARPTSAGTHSRTIQIQYNNGATTQTLSILLTTQAVTAAVLAIDGPAPIQFGDLPTGSSSDQTLTLRHISGGVAAASVAPTAPSGFVLTGSTCGASLAVGASCTLAVRFAPTARGTYNSNFSVAYNDGALARTATQSMRGRTQAYLTLSPGAANFGPRATASTHSLALTLTHSGGVTASALAASVSGTGFSLISNSCTSVISSGSCTLTVGFTPSAQSAYSGTLNLAFDHGFGADSLAVVLSGSGSTPAQLQITGTTAMANTLINASVLDFSLTLRNTGASLATGISSSNPSAVFRYRGSAFPGTGGNCGTTLAAGAQCTLNLSFAPTVTGSHSANLLVNYHNGNATSSTNATLSGSSVAAAVLTLAATTVNFSMTSVGATSTADLTVVKSAGTGPASNLRVATLAAPFSQVAGGSCPAEISATGSCTLRFRFAPGTPMRTTTAFTLTYFDGLVDRVLAFSMAGHTPAAFTLTPAGGIALGDRAVGGTFQAVFTLSRTGGPASVSLAASTTGSGLGFAGGGFPGSGGTCTSSWSGTSCTLVTELSPTALGPWSGTLSVSGDDGFSATSFSRTVSLVAKYPASIISPDSLITFPDTVAGATVQEIVILENTGELTTTAMTGSLSGSGFQFRGGAYPGTGGTCGSTLAAGDSCTVLLQFNPSGSQVYLGNLMLPYHDGAQDQAFALPLRGSGTGSGMGGKTLSRTRSVVDQDGDGLSDHLLEQGAGRVVVVSSVTGAALFDATFGLSDSSPAGVAVWTVADLNGDAQPETLWQWELAGRQGALYEIRAHGSGVVVDRHHFEGSTAPLGFTARGEPSWNAIRLPDGFTWEFAFQPH